MTKAVRVIGIGEAGTTLFNLRYAFPQPVLMQGDRISISQIELIGIQAVDQNRAAHSLLFSVDEDSHELRLLPFLGGGQLTFRFRHGMECHC